MISTLGCGVKSCGKTYKCIYMVGGRRSGWYCKDCKDYCNVCKEPFEKGAGCDCESCRLSSDARICPDCVDENQFVRCCICKITFCQECDDNLMDAGADEVLELPVYRDCCEKLICNSCAPRSHCYSCWNRYCAEDKDCKRWHSRICKNAKRGKVEK